MHKVNAQSSNINGLLHLYNVHFRMNRNALLKYIIVPIRLLCMAMLACLPLNDGFPEQFCYFDDYTYKPTVVSFLLSCFQ